MALRASRGRQRRRAEVLRPTEGRVVRARVVLGGGHRGAALALGQN